MKYAAVVGSAFLVLAGPAFAEAVETSPEASSPPAKSATHTKTHSAHKAPTKGKTNNSHHHNPSTGSGKPVHTGGDGGSNIGGSPSGPG
jgi:hypothetical protein